MAAIADNNEKEVESLWVEPLNQPGPALITSAGADLTDQPCHVKRRSVLTCTRASRPSKSAIKS